MARTPIASHGRQVMSAGRDVVTAARLKTPPVTDQLTAHYAARLESFADGDAVGTLTDQQASNDLTQATSSKKPTFRDNATDNIGGHPVIEFDGSDDILTAGAFYTPTSGEIILVMRIVAIDDFATPCSSSDGDTSDREIRVQLHNDTDNSYRILEDDGGTPDILIDGASSVGVVMVGVRSSGTAYNIRVDGTDQSLSTDSGSNSGDWFGDVTGLSNFTVGARIQAGTGDEISQMDLELAEMLMYSKELSSTERSDVEDWLNNTVGYGVF